MPDGRPSGYEPDFYLSKYLIYIMKMTTCDVRASGARTLRHATSPYLSGLPRLAGMGSYDVRADTQRIRTRKE
jgi:hypothetical protein